MRGIAERLFAERHIAIRSRRRIRYLTLSRATQIIAFGAVLVGGTALVGLAAKSIIASRLVADKQAEARQAELSNSDLRLALMAARQRVAAYIDALEATRAQLSAATQELDRTKGSLAGTTEELDAARGRLAALSDQTGQQRQMAQNRLRNTESALLAKTNEAERLSRSLEMARAEQASLDRRVGDLTSALAAASSDSAHDKAALDAAQRKLEELGKKHEAVVAERDHLLGRIAVLQQPQAQKPHEEKIAKAASEKRGAVQVASAPAASGAFDYLATRTRSGWTDFVGLLSSAGVDIDRLTKRLGATTSGEGGPFVPLLKGKAPSGGPPPAEVEKLFKTLPLVAPLAKFQFESPFGVRTDPFNHRQSIHTGVDLAAPYRSAVYNTAPGTVIYAGSKGDYGRVVEIDHGGGIVTLYAHLHRIMVARGQHLKGRVEIGQLGSTGRSTGPHVHYEVLVDGVPQDPMKFMRAGKTITQVSGN